jgi:hypothetical protein
MFSLGDDNDIIGMFHADLLRGHGRRQHPGGTKMP